MAAPLLKVENLSVRFRLKNKQELQALSVISFSLQAGEMLGIVGESGCGKSTLLRTLLQLIQPACGYIEWQGQAINLQQSEHLQAFRRAVQCIFQDPLDALDPRMTVGDSIEEPLRALRPDLSKTARQARVAELLQNEG